MTALGNLLLLIAGCLFVFGWLVPNANDVHRFTFRYLATGFAAAAMWMFALHRLAHHNIVFACIDLACALMWSTSAERWWKATEKSRADRLHR